MILCLRNHDQRLVVVPVIEEHRLVEAEPDSATAARAAKQVAAEWLIFLSGHLVMTDRAGGNVPEMAVGAYRWKDGSDDIAAVLARLTDRPFDFSHIDAIVVSILAQHPCHLIRGGGGELEIGALLFVAVRTVYRIVRVDLNV
jgi:hypothetical protein